MLVLELHMWVDSLYENIYHSLECIVVQVQLALGHDDAGLGLALVGGAGHAANNVAVAVCVDDDTVLAQLLLDENDLQRTMHHVQVVQKVGHVPLSTPVP